MEQLKLCKCGNNATLKIFGLSRVKLYFVYCKKCKEPGNCYLSRKEAIEDWNRRAGNTDKS